MRTTVREADRPLSDMEPFRTRTNGEGGLWATANPITEAAYSGSLPGEYSKKLTHDVLNGRIAYVVYSYRTPIAWVTDDGEHIMPDVRYSQTTSHHQNIVRKAWSGAI